MFLAPVLLLALSQAESARSDQGIALTGRAVADTGDPLPAGAIRRIGSLHLHQGGSWRDKVAFSPTGKVLASAGGSRIKLWDASTGKMVRELAGHCDSGVESIAFSPDGKLLASGGSDWTCRIWDVETGRQVHLLRAHRFGHLGAVYSNVVAFTPDGASLVTGGHEGVIQVWDVATGAELLKLEPTNAARGDARQAELVGALAVSPDGKTLAMVNGVRRVSLWDLGGGQPAKPLAQEAAWVTYVRFTPDGKTLAWCHVSPSAENPVEGVVFWDVEHARPGLKLTGHKALAAYSFDISSDGKRLVSGCGDATIRVWDLSTGDELRTISGLKDVPWSVALSPDGKTVASAGGGAIQLWDVATGVEQLPNPQGHWGAVEGLTVSSDGKTVLIAGKDRAIRVCDLATGRMERSFAFQVDEYWQVVGFSPDGARAAIAYGPTVDVWDTTTGQRLWSRKEFGKTEAIPDNTKPQPHSVVFSPDGKLLVSSVSTQTGASFREQATVIRVWDVTSGDLIAQFDRASNVASGPVLSPDGKTLALNEYKSGDRTISDSAIRVYDTRTGRMVRELIARDPYGNTLIYGNSMASSSDGKLLATGTSFNRIYFWDAQSGELQFSLRGPRIGLTASVLAIAPDGARLAASSSYGETELIQVWDIASGKLTHEFGIGARYLCFSPDGSKLITGHEDGTALVWDISSPSVQPQRKLTRQEIEQRWIELGYCLDSSRGNQGNYQRTDALVEGGDESVAFLEEQLLDPTLPQRDEEHVRRLVAPLGDADPKARQQAVREILKYGDRAYLSVHGLGDEPASAEAIKHVEAALLECLKYRRSMHGAIDMLGQIGTTRARELLKKLADGPHETVEQKNRQAMAKYKLEDLERSRLRGRD